MVAVAHLEQLAEPSNIIDNCAYNVQVITGNIQALNQSISVALGMDDVGYSVNSAPERPNTDKLNRSAWLYVVAVMRWCQEIVGDCVELGDNYGLMDDMGNPVEQVTIWVPSESLILDNNFQDQINKNWELIDGMFDQLFEDYETIYQ